MNVKEDYVSELWEGVRKELGRMVNNLVQSKNQEGDHFSGTGLIEQPTTTLSKEEMLELLTASYEKILNDEMKDFIDDELEKGKYAIRNEAADLQKTVKEKLEIEQLKFIDNQNQKEAKLIVLEDEVRGKAKDLDQTTEMYKAQITNEIRTIEESQRKLNGDLLLQLYLFPQKSLARKAALVTAVVLSNHLVSQIIFLSQPWKDGGGNAAVACGLAVCILSGVLFYFDTGR